MNPNGPSESKRNFDLEERTSRFGEQVIGFARQVPINLVTQALISQLVRAATSIGANWCEADDAGTKKEFRYRISICKREGAAPDLRGNPSRKRWDWRPETKRNGGRRNCVSPL